ncbi:cation efflux family-domain-containing protein [Hyaloraphidium curvatum]|nr:cation efflux family-domain-containing protein [Hyaloraphidium curvatum]
MSLETRFFRVSPLQSGASAPPTAPDSPLPISTLPPPVPASSRPIQPTLKDKLNVEPEFVPLPTDPEAYQIWLGEWKSMRKKEARLASAQGQKSGMESTLKVVAIAMAGNLVMFIVKAYTAYTSGSSSMVSEALHSLADSLNQCLLAYGIYRSMQAPDPLHPYGFQSERFAWALVSGVGIFFLGGGVSIQHGIHGLMHPEAIGAVGTAIGVLAANFAVDSYSLHTAWNEVKEKAVEQGMKPLEYVTKGVDPTTTAVFYEDLAALGGVVIALSCIGLSHVTGNPFYDSAGSIAIGAILAWVAVRLIRQNVNGLVGTSMNPQKLNAIVSALKKDPVVLSVHDVKSITRGSNWARFKAEINFDGAQVVRRYRERLAASDLPPEALAGMSFDFLMKGQGLQSEADASKWLEAHGRGILEQVGLEIDRLEKIVFDIAPEVKHVDIEVL